LIFIASASALDLAFIASALDSLGASEVHEGQLGAPYLHHILSSRGGVQVAV
jgi:hypothetical protein